MGAPRFANLRKKRKGVCEQKNCQVEKREWEAGGWREGVAFGLCLNCQATRRVLTRCTQGRV